MSIFEGALQSRVQAYQGNPDELRKRLGMTKNLFDALALSIVEEKLQSAKNQMVSQMAAQQGEAPTVTDALKEKVMADVQEEVNPQKGLAQQTTGIAQNQQQQQQLMKQMMGAARGGQSPQPLISGIAAAPGAKVGMAGGGIVAFDDGGRVNARYGSMPLPNAPESELSRMQALSVIANMDDAQVTATASKLVGSPIESPAQARLTLAKMFGNQSLDIGMSGAANKLTGMSFGASTPMMGGRMRAGVDVPRGQGSPSFGLQYNRQFDRGGIVGLQAGGTYPSYRDAAGRMRARTEAVSAEEEERNKRRRDRAILEAAVAEFGLPSVASRPEQVSGETPDHAGAGIAAPARVKQDTPPPPPPPPPPTDAQAPRQQSGADVVRQMLSGAPIAGRDFDPESGQEVPRTDLQDIYRQSVTGTLSESPLEANRRQRQETLEFLKDIEGEREAKAEMERRRQALATRQAAAPRNELIQALLSASGRTSGLGALAAAGAGGLNARLKEEAAQEQGLRDIAGLQDVERQRRLGVREKALVSGQQEGKEVRSSLANVLGSLGSFLSYRDLNEVNAARVMAEATDRDLTRALREAELKFKQGELKDTQAYRNFVAANEQYNRVEANIATNLSRPNSPYAKALDELRTAERGLANKPDDKTLLAMKKRAVDDINSEVGNANRQRARAYEPVVEAARRAGIDLRSSSSGSTDNDPLGLR